jgi:hypothetical protein
MAIAMMAATRSTCLRRQVGAVVTRDRQIVSIIYRNFASIKGFNDIGHERLYKSLFMESPFGTFQGLGIPGLLLLYVYMNIYMKQPLALQAGLWAIFLWNFMMGEIHIYLIKYLEKT